MPTRLWYPTGGGIAENFAQVSALAINSKAASADAPEVTETVSPILTVVAVSSDRTVIDSGARPPR